MNERANVIRMPGIEAVPARTPKTDRAVMETVLLTPEGVDRWKIPPFQREKRITTKVKELVEELRAEGGIIPGVLTLGKFGPDTYLVDGQHRVEAFRLSELQEGLADVRIKTFASMADMADEFVQLNSALVRMKNDDILRGLEATNPHLAAIRKRCPFVGYSNIRREGAPGQRARVLVAMSAAVRVWYGSKDTPNPGPSTIEVAKMLDENEAKRICQVLSTCHEAWGYDVENFRLWGALNLGVTFWLWRRIVLREGMAPRRGGAPIVTLTPDEFRQCMMAVSANKQYIDWLMGRGLRERDRSPAYDRMRSIVAGRLGGMGYGRPNLPQAKWASH